MSLVRQGRLGHLTRGGQTTIHFVRMGWQVVIKALGIFACALVVATTINLFQETSPYQRHLVAKGLESYLKVSFLKDVDATTEFRLPTGEVRKTFAADVLRNSEFNKAWFNFNQSLKTSSLFGLKVSTGLMLLLALIIYRTGKRQTEDDYLRGGQRLPAAELRRLLRKSRVGEYCLSDVPLPQNAETTHFIFMGSPGTGKSQSIQSVLSQIRKNKKRAIVYDTSGDFVKAFYREGKDVILNPFDTRAVAWSFWQEAKTTLELEQMAASLIPEPKQSDPFWAISARTLFVALAQKVREKGLGLAELNRVIQEVSLNDFCVYLADTPAASIASADSDKMVASIRGVLSSYTKALTALPDKPSDFSIKDWITNEEDSWVFITTKPEYLETLKPLITLWLDFASTSLMSLAPSDVRRVWMIIDELPSLNKLPNLLNFLAQSRKYGGAAILGFQSYPQLADIYGVNGADAIAGACSNWLVFRCNESRSAEWASKAFGQTDFVETSEGISYGVNDIRDGVSLSKTRKQRPIILPTEITQQKDLEAFLKLGRGYPVTQVKVEFQSLPEVAEAFADVPSIDYLRPSESPILDKKAPVEEEELPDLEPPEEVITPKKKTKVQTVEVKPEQPKKETNSFAYDEIGI